MGILNGVSVGEMLHGDTFCLCLIWRIHDGFAPRTRTYDALMELHWGLARCDDIRWRRRLL
jgi:hypothetical protein